MLVLKGEQGSAAPGATEPEGNRPGPGSRTLEARPMRKCRFGAG